jgi:c-di-GMP-binding flagellar brake protein YcgR
MTVIMPPTPGEDVNILAPHARLRGRVTGGRTEGLTIELDQTPIRRPFRLAAGLEVAVEWLHKLGVMQISAKVEGVQADPRPTLTLELVGTPEPIERREHSRVRVQFEVSAWTLAQPTRRLSGSTVDLSAAGSLLLLPDLAPLAALLELAIGLPGQPVHVSARVVWRREPALVGVQFERISPQEQTRLIEFLRTLR